MLPAWDKLVALAQHEVRQTLAALPADLRATAQALPVVYEPMPNAALIADGLDPDILGLFVGGDRDAEEHSLIPAQILLFLENIWLMIEDEGGDETDYRAEVRTTLLHELGHYLGLDEDDLTERGLE